MRDLQITTIDQTEMTGYSCTSILIHWLAALLVIALFVTHEGALDNDINGLHISGGAVVGLFLLWRVWRRIYRGMTQKPEQAFVYNIASQIVIWGFLAAIVVVVISGYLLPWSLGQPLSIYEVIIIPSPMTASPGMRTVLEQVHALSGEVFVPLLFLHLLGVAKHALIDRDGIARRMFKPISGGR